MENSLSYQDFQQVEQGKSAGGLIDIKRVLFRALKLWYLIVLSLIISFTAVYLINRYTTRIYPIKASIIIQENQKNGGVRFLYSNNLVETNRNYFNELYIIRSYAMVKSVVDELNLNVSFYRKGNIKMTEYYDHDFPLDIRLLNEYAALGAFEFSIINENQCLFVPLDRNDELLEDQATKIGFGQTSTLKGEKILISKQREVQSQFIGKKFIIRFHNASSITNAYIGKLRVRWAEAGASVVYLELKGATPDKEKMFLTTLIQKYQKYDLDKKRLAAYHSLKFIEEQLALIADSLKHFENEMERFKKANVVTDLEKESQRLYSKLEGLEGQKAKMALQTNYYRYLKSFLENSENYDQVVPPSSVDISDPIISQLVTKLLELQLESKLYGDRIENPVTQTKKVAMENLRDEILRSVTVFEQTQAINIAFINSQVRILEKELGQLPETESALINLQRNYDLQENMYKFLMQKQAEAGVSVASTTSDIEEVDPPQVISGAITPKTSQNYAFSVVAGLVIPFAFFFLLEVLNNKVLSKDDIEKISTMPIIGGIGHDKNKENLIVRKKPRSRVAEAFRSLRSNLIYFTQSKEKTIILVTSSISGEGKSFTALNLSTVLAFSGKKTIIVGADMRHPKLYIDLGLTNSIGLSSYLSGMSSLEDCIQESNIDNLYLLSGGPIPPNPSELLLKEDLAAFFKTLQKTYDYIVVDTPPIMLVTDAHILAKHVDHTIFLVRQNYTPRDMLRATQELYEQGQVSNISILFNDIKKSGPGYGYGYGYAYGYQYGYGKSKKNDYYNDES